VLQDIWIDLERFDFAKSATKSTQGFWQGVQRQLRWQDDPAANDYAPDGTSSRDFDFVKVCSPDEADVNDPEEFVLVPVIRSMRSRGADQNYQDRQVNDETVQSRKVTVRRIVHYDTNIDSAAQDAFDADSTLKAYVVRGVDYTRDDTTKDDGQYVEHEIVEFFKPRANSRDDIVSQVNQNVQVKLLNQYLIDESDDPDGAVVGNNGINPPYRLDPWQNIVNVNLGSGATFAAGILADQSGFNGTLLCLRDRMPAKKSEQNWQSTGTFSKGDHVFNCRCGAYGDPGKDTSNGVKGTPTFILGGIDFDFTTGPPTGVTYQSFIVTSTDGGKNWSKTYFTVNGFVEVATYDKNKQLFYAQTTDLSSSFFNWDWVIISSPDGITWKEIKRIPNGGFNPNYASPIIVNASDSIYKDSSGHNCPGGVYGYNKGSRMVIAPYPDILAYTFVSRQSGDRIQILKFDKDGNRISQDIKSIRGLKQVFSVAYAGGIWMASGHDGADNPGAVIACSVDNGKNWATAYTRGTSFVPVVLGAPKNDFPSGTF